MSEDQKKFIRQLRITLISVLGPMIVTGLVLTGINLQRINTNEKHVQALEDSKVSKETNLIYINQLRELITLTKENLEKNDDTTNQKIEDINKKMDKIVNDIYKLKTEPDKPRS